MSYREPLIGRLLGVPLFHKILVANAVIVLAVALIGAWLAAEFVGGASPLGRLLALAAAGVAVSVAVNAALVHVALEPLRLLKGTAERMQAGDVDTRVPSSPLADREMKSLTAAVNDMLDRLATYRERLREVAARALRASEEERRRISLELHDDTSQRLAAMLVRLHVARSLSGDPAQAAELEALRAELAETADGLHRYARGLRPPALEALGLAAALESHVRTINETSRVPVSLRTAGVGRLESPDAELALYRIAQEAIANAVRHSQADRVDVSLDRVNDGVIATVADDGTGFDPDRLLSSRSGAEGLGLFGMRERAAYVGGLLDIETRPGGGTTVRAVVPAGGIVAPLGPRW